MYDVVIAGAGPAGATAACCLAESGVRVLLVDKATFPREKACGGGLQARLLKHIPVDLSPVIRSAMYGVTFTHQFGERYTRSCPEPLVFGTLRREFDAFLVGHAVRRGATLLEATTVKGFEKRGDGSVDVSTSGGAFRGRVLVGADGANGVVRRALNDESAFFSQVGLYCEIDRGLIREENVDPRLMRVDWGTLASGYAWIFPKTDVINVGVGCPVPLGRSLREYFREFLERERVLKADSPDLERLGVSGHKLPTLTGRTRLQDGNVILIGDAAGLIEPFTGDGISYGVHSGRLAAATIAAWLNGDCPDLSEYTDSVGREIAPEILHSRKLMAFFNTFPRMIHDVFRRNDRVWEAFCRILQGDQSYAALRRTETGPSDFAWKLIDRFTLNYEANKMATSRARETRFQQIVRRTLGYVFERV